MQDDPINAKALQKRLQSDSHQVAHATNGQEVTGAISVDREFDCGLMDIQLASTASRRRRCIDKGHFRMPIKDGFHAIQATRGPGTFNLLQFHLKPALTIHGRIPSSQSPLL